MFFDFQYGGIFDSGFVSFPDWPFSNKPLSNSEILDTVILIGDSNNQITLTGSADPGN